MEWVTWLVQLCAPQFCLIDSTACLHNILPVSSIQENFRADELLSNARKYEEYITLVLNCTVLRRLVQLIQLPQTLLIHLEAQLLYLRMCLKLCSLRPQRSVHTDITHRIFDDVSGEGDSSSGDDDGDRSDYSNSSYDSSTEEDEGGDSDLEYWWFLSGYKVSDFSRNMWLRGGLPVVSLWISY